MRDGIADWAEQVTATLIGNYPPMPAGVVDRDADVWEPLIAIADAAGGDWPIRTRVAAVALITAARDNTPSLGVRLLADLRTVFEASHTSESEKAMHSDAILSALIALDESPWADMRGKSLDARRLATYLRQYGIQPRSVRIGATVARGYRREDLHDAWSRYLPLTLGTSVTSVTNGITLAVAGFPANPLSATADGSSVAAVTPPPRNCSRVTDVTLVSPPRERAPPDSACVQCCNCGWLEPPATCGNDTCGNYETSIDPDLPRTCGGFHPSVL